MRGLFDTAIISSKVHTSDGRGGAVTTYTVKIPSLVCSIQPIRREETVFPFVGIEVIATHIMIFENITVAPFVETGDVAEFKGEKYLVVHVEDASGIGSHSEAIVKLQTSDTMIQ
jgi:hypothetical protein